MKGLYLLSLVAFGVSWLSTASAVSLSLVPKPHPLVIWHGLGDSAHSEGIDALIDQLKEAFPGLYVHSVNLGGTSDSEDRKQGFFGHVNDQVQVACDQLASIDELSGGFDAIGFSQGGQFLRAYVQRCNQPRVRNLVTFGSQHMGIADLPACGPTDILCRLAEGALRGGIYTDYAQSHLVSAQYYRNPKDPHAFASYLTKNDFIKDINNEGSTQNQTYKQNLPQLDNFVMLMFDKDVTVEPKQSSWFASYPIRNESDSDGQGDHSGKNEPTPLRQSVIYTEDRIGLRQLDKRGGLVMELCHGVHMQIDPACQLKVFGKYVGTPSASFVPSPIRNAWARALFTTTGWRLEDFSGMLATNIVLGLTVGVLIRLTVEAVSRTVSLVRNKRERQGRIRLV